MARPSIFPLPDAQARAIIAAVDGLVRELPPGGPARAFLARFIPEVYRITGKVYGHTTYRQMLELYAPDYRPSTDTLRAEIDAFREALHERHDDADELARRIQVRISEVMPSRPKPPPRVEYRPVPQNEASAELSRLQLLEIDRLRREQAETADRAARAEAARQALVMELAAERARADSLESAQATLQALVKDLTATVERTQSQADANHRHGLLMVDEARGETRQQAALVEQLRQKLATRDAELRDARQMIDTQRRRINDLLAKIPGAA
jgi:hypothetical protein